MADGRRWWRVGAPALLALALLVLWQWYSSAGAGAALLPPPLRVLEAGWDDRADLWANTLPTLRAALLGFALALVVGFALSALIDFSLPARRAVMPLLIITQTLPLIVLAPLMVLWFGFGLLPKVLLVALVTFFPITVSLVHGYASGGPESHDVMAGLGSSRWQEFWHLRLPSAMPSLFSGVRIGITYAVVAAVFAEYAGAREGLGIYMQVAKNSFRTDLVLAAVVVTSLLTLALYALTFAVERAVVPWHRDRPSPTRTRPTRRGSPPEGAAAPPPP